MKNNRLVRNFGLIMGVFVFMLILSGCIIKAEEVTFKLDKPLSASQKIYVQYSDGDEPDIYTGTGTEFTFPTKAEKWIVGFYINEGAYNWVPKYSYANSSIIDFSDIEKTKPDFPAASAVLHSADFSGSEYASVTFAVYGTDGNLADGGQTVVFAHSNASTIFYDNDPLTTSDNSAESVEEGFLSYTQNGLVTFLIKSGGSTDISSIPLELYSGNKQIYGSVSSRLSALSLSSGEFTPEFDAEQTMYSTTVENNVTSLTVTPSVTDSNARIEVRVNSGPAATVDSGLASDELALNEGENLVKVEVYSPNGISKTYTVIVIRKSSNADLSGLSLSQGTLDSDFAAETISYSSSVANSVSSLTVTPTVSDTNASVTVSVYGNTAVSVSSGHASGALALNVGDNSIVVTVTAHNGTTTKTYTVTVTRAAGSLAANADLSGLSLSEGTLNTGFAAGTLSYSSSVANGVSSLAVTPTVADTNASLTVSVNGNTAVSVSSGHASGALALNVGDNSILVTVTAHNGTTTQMYTVRVTRAATSLAANADLSGLSLSDGTLNTGFVAGTLSYSSSVANKVSSLTVTPTVADTNASVTVSVNGNTAVSVSSGHASGALTLNVGDNSLLVTVTAHNGTTTKTYTVTVTRAGSIPSSPPASSNNDNPTTPTTPSIVSSKVTSTNGQLTVPVNNEGEIRLENEILISIPVGASLQELKLAVAKVTNTQALLTTEQILSSPVFEILKNFSENFSKPVTLSFEFDPTTVKNNQTVAVYFYDEIKKIWVKVDGGIIAGNRIEVEVDHFTKFAVFAVDIAVETPPTKPETPINLSDIAKHWAEASIKVAVSEGIVTGYLDGTFKPGNKVTRAEFAVMLINTLKPKNEGVDLTFTDTARIRAWAQKSVAQAVQASIITGYEDGTFRPNAEVTRTEMAVMIALALELPSETNAVIGFADDKDIPAWARNAVGAIKKLDLVSGNPANEFTPNSSTSRAEAVTVLLRMKEQMSK